MNLEDIRKSIDNIDDEISKLFIQRMDLVNNVIEIKRRDDIDIYDDKREKEILDRLSLNSNKYKRQIESLFLHIMELSKSYQKEKI